MPQGILHSFIRPKVLEVSVGDVFPVSVANQSFLKLLPILGGKFKLEAFDREFELGKWFSISLRFPLFCDSGSRTGFV